MTQLKFYETLSARGLELNEKQKAQFYDFFKLLVDWNSRMNLTGITKEHEVYAKHFFDSLDPFLDIDLSNTTSICDVGTGAGFPGMPLAIAYPDIQFDLIDSLGKRIDFLTHCANELELKNVRASHIRAEEFAQVKRESFGLVTSRAVARLNILIELCAPLLKIDGKLVVLKGPAGTEELQEAKNGIHLLGLSQGEVKTASHHAGERVNIYFNKIKQTPKKYPRQFGQIKKKPL